MKHALFLFCSLLWLCATPVCDAIQRNPSVTVVKAGFGLITYNDTGLVPDVTPMETLPWKLGQDYGWVLYLRGARVKGLVVRVELELPVKPKSWGEGTEVSKDGKTATYHYDADMCEITASHTFVLGASWSVIEGDPQGVYKLRLYIGEAKEPFQEMSIKFVKPWWAAGVSPPAAP